jgi:hypothetical protein
VEKIFGSGGLADPVMQRHDIVGDYWLGITKIKKARPFGRAFSF